MLNGCCRFGAQCRQPGRFALSSKTLFIQNAFSLRTVKSGRKAPARTMSHFQFMFNLLSFFCAQFCAYQQSPHATAHYYDFLRKCPPHRKL